MQPCNHAIAPASRLHMHACKRAGIAGIIGRRYGATNWAQRLAMRFISFCTVAASSSVFGSYAYLSATQLSRTPRRPSRSTLLLNNINPRSSAPAAAADGRAAILGRGDDTVGNPPSSSDLSIRVFLVFSLIEIKQTVPCRAIRGNSSISVNSTLPPS